jgi:hypothetical protein
VFKGGKSPVLVHSLRLRLDGSRGIDGHAGETPLNRREVGGNLTF